MNNDEQSIDLQASEFASKITGIAQIFGGPEAEEFVSEVVRGKSGWLVEIHNNNCGFTLNADEHQAFLVQASWTCSSDHSGRWLKVGRSSFGVYLSKRPNRPLFRYDFNAEYQANLPKAHIHFQADHPDMNPTEPMRDTQVSLDHVGEGSKRARKRAKHEKRINVSDLHFPVGGTRFRPSLEDVLLMMVEEYGIVPWELEPHEAVARLRETIVDWRKSQTRAVIRDMPSLAIEYFESQGFRLVDDSTGTGPVRRTEDVFEDRPERLLDS